jgi:hypothetical protein
MKDAGRSTVVSNVRDGYKVRVERTGRLSTYTCVVVSIGIGDNKRPPLNRNKTLAPSKSKSLGPIRQSGSAHDLPSPTLSFGLATAFYV